MHKHNIKHKYNYSLTWLRNSLKPIHPTKQPRYIHCHYYYWTITRYCLLWDVMLAGPPRCPVWCRLVTVPTDPFTTFTRQTNPLLSEWAKCQPGNTQNGKTVLPIVNLMADSESGSPSSYSCFIITIDLSRLVSEIFVCDRQTDIVMGQLITAKNCSHISVHSGCSALVQCKTCRSIMAIIHRHKKSFAIKSNIFI